MEERTNESFKFMEELIVNRLEGAHRTEIARVLEAIKAELKRRALADTAHLPSPSFGEPAPRPRRPPGPHPLVDDGLAAP